MSRDVNGGIRWLARQTRRRARIVAGLLIIGLVGIAAVATRDDGRVEGAAGLDPSPPAAESSPMAEASGASVAAEAAPREPAWPTEWASPAERSPIEAVPVSDRTPRPEAVRGVYVGAWTMGGRRLPGLLSLADETEVNAFVIDIKDVTGEISYDTRLPLAEQLGADRRVKIGDVRGLLERLKAHGVYPIARIVAFKDPLLADARPEWAIQREDGALWEDNNGVRWVDAYNREVWDYNISLAREAVELGFAEVQWDYVRFPDVPSTYLLEAVYPAQAGRSKVDAIRQFIAYSKEQLADLDVEITADVFGITTSTSRDIGIGQTWEKLADVTDVLLPMVYPSHYPRGSFGYPAPNAAPYQIVRRAMEDGVERSKRIPGAAGIRPWLQAFTLGDPPYGPLHIRAQIDAVYDAGLTEWILWDPRVRYPKEAFAGADGTEPVFAGQGEALYTPEPELEVEPPVMKEPTVALKRPGGR